jgi:predicted esterase
LCGLPQDAVGFKGLHPEWWAECDFPAVRQAVRWRRPSSYRLEACLMRRAMLPLFLLLVAPVLAQDAGLPYPKGSTEQEREGLRFMLVIPDDYDPAREWSLFVILHGNGGSHVNMALSAGPLVKDGFIVCAPKSRQLGWDGRDIEDVKKIVAHLKQCLSIGKNRLHGLGFSNGGWNLAPLVFDEDLHFVSACWMAAGYDGGKVPKWAKKEFGAMALAGAQDPNAAHAKATVDKLFDKVRSVECHIQPNLDHAWTRELEPYLWWWVKVMDGRYTPGDDMSFPWGGDVEAAKEKMAAEKLGAFVWFYSEQDDAESAEAKRVQREVFFDPLVRRFGRQLLPLRLKREEHQELFDSLKLKSTPAIAVLKKDFKSSKTFEGSKIKSGALAKELRTYAKDKAFPDYLK